MFYYVLYYVLLCALLCSITLESKIVVMDGQLKTMIIKFLLQPTQEVLDAKTDRDMPFI